MEQQAQTQTAADPGYFAPAPAPPVCEPLPEDMLIGPGALPEDVMQPADPGAEQSVMPGPYEDQLCGPGGLVDSEASPGAAQDAFGHYVDQGPAAPVVPAVDDLDDAQFQAVVAGDELSSAELQQMVDGTGGSPERKLELWKKLHMQRNAEQMNEALPESDVGEDPEKMKERVIREQTQATTGEELALETSELPPNYTMDDVDKLIARKEKEHELEQKYGVNFTAQKERRKDGSRVMWSEDELDKVGTAFEQIPEEMWEQKRLQVNEVERHEEVLEDYEVEENGVKVTKQKPIFADCHPDGKIRINDLAANTVENEARDNKSEAFEAEHGYESSKLERVMLHELGHATHHAEPEQLKAYEEATKDIPKAQHAEYFAQDFNNALTQPDQHARNSFDKPQEELAAAKAAAKANPTPENLEAVKQAEVKAENYPKMFNAMRNDVFHTDAREDEIAERMEADGASPEDIEGFRAQAQRMSTPDQLDKMASDYGYVEAPAPEEPAEEPAEAPIYY